MSDSAELLEEVPPESGQDDLRIVRALMRKADRARRDPVAFFSFVMKEEKTHARIEAAAHQRLLLEFVMAHPRSVIRMPVGSSKTFSMAALTLFLLGNDPTERGAMISASQGQAEKPLSMVQDYIEDEQGHYPELHLVFPELRPSPRAKDPWTQKKLVVDRPPGIRDPSLVAIGIDGKLPGARLSWIIVDDVLDEENTATPQQREKVKRLFNSTVLSRKDIEGSRIVVCNTPWHPDDLTYSLEKAGWPTLTMDIEGNVTITNAPDFDSDEIRPAYRTKGDLEQDSAGDPVPTVFRLAAHDSAAYDAPLSVQLRDGTRELAANDNRRLAGNDNAEPFDVEEEIPLWPEVFSAEKIAKLRDDYKNALYEYNQLYRCLCRSDEDAACKVEWIDRCKQLAIEAGHFSFVAEYRGPNPTVTGVDLAVGEDEKHDFTAFFTVECIPSMQIGSKVYRNLRKILEIDIGRYKGRAIVDKLVDKTRRYNSIARVETNAAQDFLRQWTLDVDVSVPIRAHTTGANKHQRVHGVAGVFIELENGAWLIPTDPHTGQSPAAVQTWIEECLYYRPPPAHTGDALMASWLARAQARLLGTFDDTGESVAAAIAAR